MISLSQRGFTLVELAIAMIVIGLVIGGVIKGQELILNAKISSTLSEYKQIYVAHHAFLDRYQSIPGDMPDAFAQARLEGCTVANNCFGPGNNNRVIGDPLPSSAQAAYFAGFASTGVYENALYWKHLAMAKLIKPIDITASNNTADFQPDVTHLSSSLEDVIWDVHNTVTPFLLDFSHSLYSSDITGNFLLLNTYPRSYHVPFNRLAIPLNITVGIDEKIDDGSALSGFVSAGCVIPDTTDPPVVMALINRDYYDIASTEAMCHLVIGFD